MKQEYIENYALIGDCHGCALISRHASIDWLTFERFDSDPLYWQLLDDEKGAHLSLKMDGQWQWHRQYLANTNILLTTASNVESTVRIIDYMPVGRNNNSRPHDYTKLVALHGLVRIIEVEGKEVDIQIMQRRTRWPGSNNNIFIYIGNDSIKEVKDELTCKKVDQDRPLNIVLSKEPLHTLDSEQLRVLFEITKSYWEEWIAYSRFRGPHQKLVERSALALKLLIHSPSGAIMAAATTSLPESIGGERNWDYRYCWIRDATFTLYALSYLGYSGEADGFGAYFNNVISHCPGPIGVLYGIDHYTDRRESIIDGIKGYMGSRPVRTGNDAYKQKQMDTYGEFMDWAYLHHQLGGVLSNEILIKIEETAELVKNQWRVKDQGLWEVRSEPEDFTYSKIMCWVTLDRAESLLKRPGRYKNEKQAIEDFVSENCIFEGRLKRSAQSNKLDASLLLSKVVAFPVQDDVYVNTVDLIIKELSDGVFVKRYVAEDGLKGEEGEFIICSFWAVNALLFIGKEKEARDMFEKLIFCFNDLGLLSEEYDSKTNHFLGNYPQALSHLAYIETASYFELYAKGGAKALEGCHGDRVKRLHTTLHGPKAVWDYLIMTKNFAKLIPSRASVLKWKSQDTSREL